MFKGEGRALNERNELDISPDSVVRASARKFAAALSETPEFKAFDEAGQNFRNDEAAQKRRAAYQERQAVWRPLLMLNALSPEQKVELETLENDFMNQPAVQDYLKVQAKLAELCQTLGDSLSESIGINYAAACGVSCCG